MQYVNRRIEVHVADALHICIYCCRASARIAGKAAVNSASSASVMVRAGAMRTVRASGALTMNLAAQALGQSDGVWQVLAGGFTGVFGPAASTTHVGLDLVHDQQGALLAGEFAGTGEVTCEQRQDAGLPLDGFDDEGSDVVGQIFFEGFEGSGYMFDAGGKRFEGLTVGGLPGEGKSPDSSPVEAVVMRARVPRSSTCWASCFWSVWSPSRQ